MRKFLIVFNILLFLFLNINLASAKQDKRLQAAAVYLENLNTNMAYKGLDVVIKNLPQKSAEAGEAVVLKAVISATEFSSLDMLCSRYSEALQKAKTTDVKKGLSKLYMEASFKMAESGRLLTNDVEDLLEYTDKNISLEIKKSYDSLGLATKAFLAMKKLEDGELPTSEEIEMIEDCQKDISYRYVLGKLLGSNDLTASRTIKGNIDWADTLLLMGNWLVRIGTVNKSGWIDPKNQKLTKSLVQAEKSFLMAKQCFEKVRRLSKEQSIKAQAYERIKEINQILRELKGGG